MQEREIALTMSVGKRSLLPRSCVPLPVSGASFVSAARANRHATNRPSPKEVACRDSLNYSSQYLSC